MQGGGIQDGNIELNIAISQLLRLNLERECFMFYGSINPIESVKLASVNYFWQIQDGDIQDGRINNGIILLSCVRAPFCFRSYIRPLYWKATGMILGAPLGSNFGSIVLVVGGFHMEYGFATISDMYTDGWHTTILVVLLGIGHGENRVTRVMTDTSRI